MKYFKTSLLFGPLTKEKKKNKNLKCLSCLLFLKYDNGMICYSKRLFFLAVLGLQ